MIGKTGSHNNVRTHYHTFCAQLWTIIHPSPSFSFAPSPYLHPSLLLMHFLPLYLYVHPSLPSSCFPPILPLSVSLPHPPPSLLSHPSSHPPTNYLLPPFLFLPPALPLSASHPPAFLQSFRLTPPLCVQKEDIEFTVEVIRDALIKFQRNK